jgi:hypothetical protein
VRHILVIHALITPADNVIAMDSSVRPRNARGTTQKVVCCSATFLDASVRAGLNIAGETQAHKPNLLDCLSAATLGGGWSAPRSAKLRFPHPT